MIRRGQGLLKSALSALTPYVTGLAICHARAGIEVLIGVGQFAEDPLRCDSCFERRHGP
jgi:hypothetical protein